MSNLIKTIDYLKDNPERRFVTITVVGTEQQVGKKEIYLKDIPNQDLGAYIKTYLGHLTAPVVVYLELRQYNGPTSKKYSSFSAQVTPDNYLPPVENQPVQKIESTPQPRNEQLSAAYSADGMMRVPINDVLNHHKNESKVENLKEKIEELKEDKLELKDKIRRIQKKYDDVDSEVRNLKSELSIANSQKDMAVLLAKAENSSFLDKIPFDKLMDNAPKILGQIVAMKGGTPMQEGALGAPNLSPEKREFIEYVTQELTDDEAELLGKICNLIKSKAGFYPQLQQLIQTNI